MGDEVSTGCGGLTLLGGRLFFRHLEDTRLWTNSLQFRSPQRVASLIQQAFCAELSSHRTRGLTRRSVSMQAEDALRQHAGEPQYVLGQLIKQGIDKVPHPRLQLAMVQAFTEMQQGSSPGFQLLRGDTGR